MSPRPGLSTRCRRVFDAATDWFAGTRAEDVITAYVHVPFCRRLCWYCGCHTTVAHEYDRIDETKVHEAARTAVIEVPEYLRAVDAFVTARSEGS